MSRIEIKLDVSTMDDALYDALLAAFREEAKKQGIDPEGVFFWEWIVSSIVEDKV